jgi:geranylgeranyl pyrophosphate synthase
MKTQKGMGFRQSPFRRTGAEDVDLKTFLAAEKERVEEALLTSLERLVPRVPRVYEAALRHGVTSGGKRLRPILCVAGYRAVGGRDPGIYDLAISLELIHAYSLMHDDLPCMDDADLRRGEPTTHRLYGEAATMVAGALLIPGAAVQAWEGAIALGCSTDVAGGIVRELARAAGGGGMVGGQVLDLLGEERHFSSAELDDLHRRKTGALLRASLTIGGMAAGASRGELAALDRYGAAIGLAFQIADDLLDATSTAEALGKTPSDEDRGKSTYVSLHGLEEARRRAHKLVEEALDALSEGGLEAPELEALAHYIVDRDR